MNSPGCGWIDRAPAPCALYARQREHRGRRRQRHANRGRRAHSMDTCHARANGYQRIHLRPDSLIAIGPGGSTPTSPRKAASQAGAFAWSSRRGAGTALLPVRLSDAQRPGISERPSHTVDPNAACVEQRAKPCAPVPRWQRLHRTGAARARTARPGPKWRRATGHFRQPRRRQLQDRGRFTARVEEAFAGRRQGIPGSFRLDRCDVGVEPPVLARGTPACHSLGRSVEKRLRTLFDQDAALRGCHRVEAQRHCCAQLAAGIGDLGLNGVECRRRCFASTRRWVLDGWQRATARTAESHGGADVASFGALWPCRHA